MALGKLPMSIHCASRLRTDSADSCASERMVLPLWRSLHSLNLMLPKEDRRAMLLRLYNDDSPLLGSSKDRFHDKHNGDDTETAVTDENSLVDEEDRQVSAAPGRPENEEGDVGMENEDYVVVEDEAGDHPESVTGP